MAKVHISAVIEIEDKHADKIGDRFKQFLDALPAQIVIVSITDRKTFRIDQRNTQSEAYGKQVSRQSAREPAKRITGE